ncbi:hypothetical protein SS50377_24924 [Spironucleus salmonicida]|uniref:Transmembrane protein n=1 Tax=Spironucleus salmonicida TaxID=348837 RepID=V6LFX2_9EUKA|nr:hypothetical protein SS50377_24924 [Spironucleus salmonicida]|eukprot:EST43455.1 Hypothetical protein SS50377_16819 [Spironucleus salmonicida]
MISCLCAILAKLKSETQYRVQPAYTFASQSNPIFMLQFTDGTACGPLTAQFDIELEFSCETLELRPMLRHTDSNTFMIGGMPILSVLTLPGPPATATSSIVAPQPFTTRSQLQIVIADAAGNPLPQFCSVDAIQLLARVIVVPVSAVFDTICLVEISFQTYSFNEHIDMSGTVFGTPIGAVTLAFQFGGRSHVAIDLTVAVTLIVTSAAICVWIGVKKLTGRRQAPHACLGEESCGVAVGGV